MKHEGSLPCPQQPATCPNSEPDQSSIFPAADFFKTHPRLVLRNGLLPSGLTTKPLYVCTLCHTCYKPNLSHFTGFDHPSTDLWLVQIMKPLIRKSPPFSIIMSLLTKLEEI
jgi:hypothetical protein